MSDIHPSAVIEIGAQIGEGVTIEPFAIIKKNVVIGDNVTIKAHAYIDGHTTIGDGTTIYPSAVIGTRTQDLKYEGEVTYVNIGKNCSIREYVTINSSCGEGTTVSVGDDCLIMAYCHLAHHCKVGKGVIMANAAMLAGHVEVEDYARVGGMTAVHQWVRIGKHAMVGGLSRVTHDIPPYTIGGGVPYKMGGLNLVGLKRFGYDLPVRKELSRAFKLLYRSTLSFHEALQEIESTLGDSPDVRHWLDFCKQSKRGLIGLHEKEQEELALSSDQLEE